MTLINFILLSRNTQDHKMFPTPIKSTLLILDADSFSTLMRLAEQGQLNELSCFVSRIKDNDKSKSVEFESQPCISQPAIVRSPPVVKAAQHGHQHVVEFFIRNFSNVVCVSNNQVNPTVSNSTALHEAAHWGHLGIIKSLLESSVSVNGNNSQDGTSPLHSAVIGRSEGAVQYLLANGADVNAADLKNGLSPLFEAINTHILGVYGRGQKWLCNVVQLLLKSGADICQVAHDGRTVLHLIAKANNSTSLKLLNILLQSNPNGVWKLLLSPSKGLKCTELPALLYAAESMNKHFIDFVISHPECPPGIAADALLALSTTSISPYPIHTVRELWERTFEIWQGCTGNQQDPTEPGRYRMEACSLKEAYRLIPAAIESGDVTELHYQYLNIRGRILGAGGRAAIQSLWQLGHEECEKNRFAEAEQLYTKALRMMQLNITGEYSQPGCYTHHSDLYCMLDREFSRMTLRNEIVHMIHCNYTPTYSNFVKYGLDITKQPSSKQYLTMDTPHQLLSLLGVWAYGEQNSGNTTTEEIEQVGRRIVTEESFLTILYLCFGYWEPPYVPASEHDKFISFMIDSSFQWEAGSLAINAMDCNGRRPLHVAAAMAPKSHPVCKHTSIKEIDIVSLLVDNGAHLDAVNSEGKTAYDTCSDPSVQQITAPSIPLPLTCLASRAVVSCGISYKRLTCLPLHIINFIMLHDPNAERAAFEHRWWKGY